MSKRLFMDTQQEYDFFDMPATKSSRKSAPYKRRSKNAPPSAKGVPPSIRTYVKKSIEQSAEKKVQVAYGKNQNINTVSGGFIPYTLNLCPSLAQGANQSQRIGNKIKVQKAICRVRVNALPFDSITNPTTSPIIVTAYLVTNSQITAPTTITAADYNTFFDGGINSFAWQGDILDSLLPVQNGPWKLLDKRVTTLGFSYNTSVGVQTATVPNNDTSFTKEFVFDFSNHIGSLTYPDSDSTLPVNKGLWLLFQATASDGRADSVRPAEAHYVTEWHYTDL